MSIDRRSQDWSRWRGLQPLLLLLTSGACASILGIEDIELDPSFTPGGSAGAAGTNDGNPAAGSSPKGGSPSSGGNSVNGGSSSGGGATGAGAGPDEPGGAGGAGGGTGGSGGAAPMMGPVHGHVVDIWGQDLPDVPVQVGDVLVTTDADGEFVVDDVPVTYTASLVVTVSDIERYGYVFNGLTRRDPTLQVARAWDDQLDFYQIDALNVTPDEDAGEKVSVGWAGPGFCSDTTTSKPGQQGTMDWFGPTLTVQGSGEALYWKADLVSELPTAYYTADSTSFLLGGADPARLTFDLTGAALTSAVIQGSVTEATGVDRVNKLFLRYGNGVVLELIDQYSVNTPNSFSFLAPSVPNASLTLAASEGTSSFGEYAVVHKDGLAPGAVAALKLPKPAKIAGPIPDITMVDGTTEFSITPGTHAAKTYVAMMIATFDSPYYDRLYVIGTDTKFVIPEVAGQAFMHPGIQYFWRITTHGAYETVDEMTGEAGFFDSFGVDETAPSGPRTGDGEYTISSSRLFTMKP